MKYLSWVAACLYWTTVAIYTTAFPSGAGACGSGMPAVLESHLRSDAINGTLDEGGFVMEINGAKPPTSLAQDESYEIKISGSNSTFRGILIRVETDNAAANGNDMLLEIGTDYSTATACTLPAVGLTHSENSEKSVADAVLTVFDPMTVVAVDVTVVVANGSSRSEYYYQSFEFGSTPEVMATGIPSSSPVATTTESPVAVQTESPVTATTESPVTVTTDSPAVAFTGSPTSAANAPTSTMSGASIGMVFVGFFVSAF